MQRSTSQELETAYKELSHISTLLAKGLLAQILCCVSSVSKRFHAEVPQLENISQEELILPPFLSSQQSDRTGRALKIIS